MNTYEARLKEIKRCKKVTTVLKAELRREVQPEDELMNKEELLDKIKTTKQREER